MKKLEFAQMDEKKNVIKYSKSTEKIRDFEEDLKSNLNSLFKLDGKMKPSKSSEKKKGKKKQKKS